MKIVHLKIVTSLIVVILIAVIASVFLFPQSSFAGILERFQTLFTGIFASFAALATAVWVYLAVKLPIKAELERAAEKKSVMKRAGAARLLSAVQGIHATVTVEASKSPEKRLGNLVVPDMLPSLDIISTQDNDVIVLLAEFLTSASRYDANTVLKSWPYDPDKTHPGEKKVSEEFNELGEKLAIVLIGIGQGDDRAGMDQ